MAEEFQFAKKQKPRSFQFYSSTKIPESWKNIEIPFHSDQKIILDAGCGVGEWSLLQARQNPDQIYIGIEKTKERSDKLIQTQLDEKLKNYYAIRADAILFLQTQVPKNSIDEIYFFHPNPWPKLGQSNKRYMIAPSFEIFKKSLKKGGQIYLVSNIKEYVEEAHYFLENYWDLKANPVQEYRDILNPRTPFERKYIDRKEKIFELRAIY